jgi:anion-transporting  ArsA/GET3 family ATPase
MKSALDLKDHRLIICMGPGGVGKTTLSAALALYGAIAGRSVDVMTVDPAPRLLDALALDPSRSDPQPVPLDGIVEAVHRRAHAPHLRALKLDPKRTFDSLVERHAPSASARDTILNNRIYRNLSNALSGVGDYMAMEKLLDLYSDPEADLVVLDTPPAGEALDFLDAPRRLLDLLQSRAIALLGRSGGLLRGLRVVDLAARAVLSAFDRITGLNLLDDVQAFVESFEGMYTGFAQRAEKAAALLRSPETIIVIVATAEAARIAQAREFAEALEGAGLRADAIVVNRTIPEIPGAQELSRAKISAALKKKLTRNLKDFAALKEREMHALKGLRRGVSARTRILLAPDLGREPRSLADLAEIARSLQAISR